MRKLDYLESLRGIAAFSVVISHLVIGFYPALFWGKTDQIHTQTGIELMISKTPLYLLYNGAFAVAIFFVLSGFVLSYKFFKDENSRIALVPIVCKRYTRLFPPVIVSNILAYLFHMLSLYKNQSAATLTKSAWLGSYWLFEPNIRIMLYESFIGAFFTKHVMYNGVLWTMTYELFGSMIVYVFISVFGRHPRRSWAYFVLILFFRRSYYLAFILGMMLSDIVTRDKNIFHSIRHKRYFAVLLFVGLFFGSLPSERPLEGTMYAWFVTIANPKTWYVIGSTLVMISLLNSNRLQQLLSKSFFIFLGKISFSLYLLHQLAIGTLSSGLFLALTPTMSYHAACALTFVVTILTVVSVSYIMYMIVDAKGIKASQTVHRVLTRQMESFICLIRKVLPASVVNGCVISTLFYPGGPPTAQHAGNDA